MYLCVFLILEICDLQKPREADQLFPSKLYKLFIAVVSKLTKYKEINALET